MTIAPHLWTTNAASTASCRVTLSKKLLEGDAVISCTRVTPYSSATFTSASTTPAVLTAQSIVPVYDWDSGLGWVYVEVKCSDETYLAGYWGLTKLYLGPLESY
jgi:hypothetical protein